MNQNKTVISGIQAPQIDPAQAQAGLRGISTQTVTGASPALQTFTQLQQRRLNRMAAVAQALGKQLPKNDPSLIAVQNAVNAANQMRTRLETQVVRLNRWPKPRPNEWLVYGTVTDAQGNPAAGLTVRVFDKDRKYDDLLGETQTDENGDFSVIYHERDFKEPGENLPDLYVMVSDASGKLVYSSRDSVRYEAGQSEYFAIQLGARKPRVPRKKDVDDSEDVKKRKKR